jgi:hypothetical protein
MIYAVWKSGGQVDPETSLWKIEAFLLIFVSIGSMKNGCAAFFCF